MVYNETDVRIYVNGVLASSAEAYSSGLYDGDAVFVVGALLNNGTYEDFVPVKADGSWLFTSDGKKYLDGVAAYSAANLGHNNPLLAPYKYRCF